MERRHESGVVLSAELVVQIQLSALFLGESSAALELLVGNPRRAHVVQGGDLNHGLAL